MALQFYYVMSPSRTVITISFCLDGHGKIGLMCTGQLEEIVHAITLYGTNDRYLMLHCHINEWI